VKLHSNARDRATLEIQKIALNFIDV
jgi:hypothetical protein